MELIVAMSKNKVIGKDNKMPWHLKEDLAYFRQKTMGHSVIMGRKTFESIGKPLPFRENILLTTNTNKKIEGALIMHTKEAVLASLERDKKYFVIGGAEIFKLFLPYVDKLWITQIEEEIDGDTFFPNYKQEFILKWESEKRYSENLTFSYTLWHRK